MINDYDLKHTLKTAIIAINNDNAQNLKTQLCIIGNNNINIIFSYYECIIEIHNSIDYDDYYDHDHDQKNKKTLLYVACELNSHNCAELLIRYGADLFIDYFIDDLNIYEPILNMTCKNNNTECVKILIDNKADINIAAWSEKRGQMNLEYEMDYTPLLHACENNNIECIKLLLDAKASCECYTGIDYMYPLEIACKTNNIEMLNILKNANAFDYMYDDDNISSLTMSIYDPEILQIVIDNHKDLRYSIIDCGFQKCYEFLPACYFANDLKMLNVLAKNGVNLNKKCHGELFETEHAKDRYLMHVLLDSIGPKNVFNLIKLGAKYNFNHIYRNGKTELQTTINKYYVAMYIIFYIKGGSFVTNSMIENDIVNGGVINKFISNKRKRLFIKNIYFNEHDNEITRFFSINKGLLKYIGGKIATFL
jgi:ankyrin repeat protein